MFNKKRLAAYFLVTLLTLLFTACGKQAANNSLYPARIAVTTENALEYSKLFDCDMTATIAITPDGKIELERQSGHEFFDAALNWNNITQVSTGYNTIFGLDKSGKVFGACSEKSTESIDLSNFTDITYICATDSGVYGLKKNGTVVSTGRCALDVSDWSNVKQISASGENKEIVIGLTKDGKVLVKSDYPAVYEAEGWTDIIQVSAGRLHVAGLKKDGTVVACGRPLFEEKGSVGEFDVEDWKDIVYVSADNQTTAGLRKDGTIVSTGYNAKEKYSSWTDAIALYQGGNGTFILKTDGTMTYSPLGDNFRLLK